MNKQGNTGLGRSFDPRPDFERECFNKHAAVQNADCGQSELPRDREIPAKVARLFAATDELSEKLARFGERLHGVLVPRPSQSGNCTTSATAPSATAMGEQLAQLNARLNLMIDAVDSLDATLEL